MRTAAGSALVAVLDAAVIALVVGVAALTRRWRRRGPGDTVVPARSPAQRVVDLTGTARTRVTGRGS